MADQDQKLDLDSLDQLLDEAELAQLTGGIPMDMPPPSTEAPVAKQINTPPSPPPVVTEAPKPTLPPAPAAAKAVEGHGETPSTLAAERSNPSQDKRKKVNDSTQDAWTEEEMDGIKKLIIIFGSSILVISLAAMGIALGGLFKKGEASPELMAAVEESRSGMEETYKIAESNNREIKELGQRLTEIITQISDTEAVMNDIKAINEEQLQHAMSVPATSAPSAKKLAVVEASAPTPVEPVAPRVMPSSASISGNDPQVMSLSADMKDIKRRLASAYKALESLQKQSSGLQSQSDELMAVIKSVETELKSRKAVKSSAPAATKAKPNEPVTTNKATGERYPNTYRDEQSYRSAPTNPVDDAVAKMRWQQQMDKTDSFP